MQIAYNLQTGIVVTKSGPCGMCKTKHTYTTLLFEDAFGKCEVVITATPAQL